MTYRVAYGKTKGTVYIAYRVRRGCVGMPEVGDVRAHIMKG